MPCDKKTLLQMNSLTTFNFLLTLCRIKKLQKLSNEFGKLSKQGGEIYSSFTSSKVLLETIKLDLLKRARNRINII